jgi:nucleoside-diphosphate-sugar epimerase
MMIPSMFEKVRQDAPIVIEDRPGLRINPIFVNDVVRALDAVLLRPTLRVLNVGGREEVDLTELVQIMGAVLARTPTVKYRDTHRGGPRRIVADISVLCEELGAKPYVPLREGLGRLK